VSRTPPRPDLPPLVLSCRPAWRLGYALAAIVLLALGTTLLAGVGEPIGPTPAGVAAGIVLLLLGAGCAHFFLRHCLASLSLSDGGFTILGPLRTRIEVSWGSVIAWRRVRLGAAPASIRVVYGADRRRLSVPAIYEDVHLLEIGLQQGQFPLV
jgi:hypothetical protein